MADRIGSARERRQFALVDVLALAVGFVVNFLIAAITLAFVSTLAIDTFSPFAANVSIFALIHV